MVYILGFFNQNFRPLFMDKVQLPQGCRGTKKRHFNFKSTGTPGTHLIYQIVCSQMDQ